MMKQKLRMSIWSKNGFSLMELVMTIMLLSILSVVAIPAIFDSQTVDTKMAAIKVSTDLRYAQSLAMTTGEAYGMRTQMPPSGQPILRHEVYRVSDNQFATNPHRNVPMTEDLSKEFPGTKFTGHFNVQFDDNGDPTFITGGNPITIGCGDPAISTDVEITPTGMISTQD